MASLNRVILIGNLTRDPELRYTPSGVPVCKLGLAVNRNYRNKEGEKVENVDFLNVTVWRQQGENCAQYLKKGSPVAVEGRLQSRSWETEEGQKRNIVEVIADNVQFLGKPGGARRDEQSQDTGLPDEIDDSDLQDIPF